MMYMRYTIEIYGEKISPYRLINKLDTNLIINEKDSIIRKYNQNEEDDYLFLSHKNEFSKEYPDEEYDNEFMDFFRKNYKILLSSGANDYRIFIEVYYSDQCNFEIFDKYKLYELANYGVSLPISVYHDVELNT